jgi:hypothetical protein
VLRGKIKIPWIYFDVIENRFGLKANRQKFQQIFNERMKNSSSAAGSLNREKFIKLIILEC